MVLVKPVQGLTDMLMLNMKMKTAQKKHKESKKGIAMADLAAGQNESIWWTHYCESSTCAPGPCDVRAHCGPLQPPVCSHFSSKSSCHHRHCHCQHCHSHHQCHYNLFFVAIAFCKNFFTVIQAPPLFPLFPEKLPLTIIFVNCDAILLQPIRVITSKKNDPTIMISIWSLLRPYL